MANSTYDVVTLVYAGFTQPSNGNSNPMKLWEPQLTLIDNPTMVPLVDGGLSLWCGVAQCFAPDNSAAQFTGLLTRFDGVGTVTITGNFDVDTKLLVWRNSFLLDTCQDFHCTNGLMTEHSISLYDNMNGLLISGGSVTGTTLTVPEPSTFALLLLGLLGVAVCRALSRFVSPLMLRFR